MISEELLSEEQRAKVAEQIGREPKGLIRVVKETDQGIPLVVQMRSLVDDVPFPTLYWLTSKTLCKAIGTIETQGWVKYVEQRIQDDDELRSAFLQNQQDYVAKRWELMRSEDKSRIEELGFTEMFEKYGIGGISQWDKVRCLHMQYAHHLADGNVIGALMDQEFGLDKLECVS